MEKEHCHFLTLYATANLKIWPIDLLIIQSRSDTADSEVQLYCRVLQSTRVKDILQLRPQIKIGQTPVDGHNIN